MGNVEAGRPGEVLLYCFDDGAKIWRITGADGLMHHTGGTIDLPSLTDGRYLMFALEVPIHDDPEIHKVSVVLGFPSAASDEDAWNNFLVLHPSNQAALDEVDWSLPYWAEMAEQLLIPNAELPQGTWGGTFPTPFWVDDAVYSRLADAHAQELDIKIKQLHTMRILGDPQVNGPIEQQMEQATIELVRYAFGPLMVDPNATDINDLWVSFAPKDWRTSGRSIDWTDIRALPNSERGYWVLFAMDDEMWTGSGQWETLLGALEHFTFGQIGYRYIGGPLPASKQQTWLERKPGEAVFDPSCLEPYFLLGQRSPLLWPQELFLSWYKRVTP